MDTNKHSERTRKSGETPRKQGHIKNTSQRGLYYVKIQLYKFLLIIAIIADFMIGVQPYIKDESTLIVSILYLLTFSAIYTQNKIKSMIFTISSTAFTLYLLYQVIKLYNFYPPLLILSTMTKAAAFISINMKISLIFVFKKLDITKIVSYIKDNPSSAFIIPFIILLTSAAIYLSIGLEKTANKLATYAYYQLVLGVLTALYFEIKSQNI